MPMKQTFLAKAAELLRASMRRKRWYRVCTGLAAAVVFVTTYMLILPAITLSNDQGWTVPLGVDLSVEPDYTATLTLADGRLNCLVESTEKGARHETEEL